jgi:hypothetical protein
VSDGIMCALSFYEGTGFLPGENLLYKRSIVLHISAIKSTSPNLTKGLSPLAVPASPCSNH